MNALFFCRLKLRTVKRLLFSSLLLVFSVSHAFANQETEGDTLLRKLRHAIENQNYEAAFVVVSDRNAEPYHWAHGVYKGVPLEHLSSLNGAVSELVRKGDVVSYFERNTRPYSVNSDVIPSPLPRVLYADLNKIMANYSFVAGGRSRVAGRTAQMLRVIAKDDHRFSFILWVDEASSVLLKSATVTRTGDIVEQVQVTQLNTSSEPAVHLRKLYDAALPDIISSGSLSSSNTLPWRFTWLPSNFRVVTSDHHSLPLSQTETDYYLLSDGVNEISVYIQPRIAQAQSPMSIRKGALSIVSQTRHGVDISVIGKVPKRTAEQILVAIQPENVVPNR